MGTWDTINAVPRYRVKCFHWRIVENSEPVAGVSSGAQAPPARASISAQCSRRALPSQCPPRPTDKLQYDSHLTFGCTCYYQRRVSALTGRHGGVLVSSFWLLRLALVMLKSDLSAPRWLALPKPVEYPTSGISFIYLPDNKRLFIGDALKKEIFADFATAGGAGSAARQSGRTKLSHIPECSRTC